MDQKKIGAFLKELRKEKGITQEAFAKTLGVSGRTISRWETGSNMPDLDVLIDIADYYDVEIREILDGERKSENMNKEIEETVLKAADYTNQEQQRMTRRLCFLFSLGVAAFGIYIILEAMELTDRYLYDSIASGALGFACGMMIVGVLYTSGFLARFHAFKKRLAKRG